MEYKDNRTNSATANVVNQGIEWRETYGARSAAAFLAHRAVPRTVIQRVINSADTRGVATQKHKKPATTGANN